MARRRDPVRIAGSISSIVTREYRSHVADNQRDRPKSRKKGRKEVEVEVEVEGRGCSTLVVGGYFKRGTRPLMERFLGRTKRADGRSGAGNRGARTRRHGTTTTTDLPCS